MKKLIDFERAMSILESAYKEPDYKIDIERKEIGPISAHREIRHYMIGDREVLMSSMSCVHNDEPKFWEISTERR